MAHVRVPAETPLTPGEDARALSATIIGGSGDLDDDVVTADVTVRFPMSDGQQPVAAHASLNLNEICTSLLADWWRILYRRGDPFKMFPVEKETNEDISQAVVLAESTGKIELYVRSLVDDSSVWGLANWY